MRCVRFHGAALAGQPRHHGLARAHDVPRLHGNVPIRTAGKGRPASRSGSARSAHPSPPGPPRAGTSLIRRATSPAICRTRTGPAAGLDPERSAFIDAARRVLAPRRQIHAPPGRNNGPTRPATGALCTCTSNTLRKIVTRVAVPPMKSSPSIGPTLIDPAVRRRNRHVHAWRDDAPFGIAEEVEDEESRAIRELTAGADRTRTPQLPAAAPTRRVATSVSTMQTTTNRQTLRARWAILIGSRRLPDETATPPNTGGSWSSSAKPVSLSEDARGTALRGGRRPRSPAAAAPGTCLWPVLRGRSGSRAGAACRAKAGPRPVR